MDTVLPNLDDALHLNPSLFGNTSYVLENILENVLSRSPPSILENEVATVLNEIIRIDSGFIGLDSIGTFTIEDNSPVEHIRGGIAGNYTDSFYQHGPDDFITWQSQVLQLENPFQFKQYIILGDGNGVGSTANTFEVTSVTLNTEFEYASFKKIDFSILFPLFHLDNCSGVLKVQCRISCSYVHFELRGKWAKGGRSSHSVRWWISSNCRPDATICSHFYAPFYGNSLEWIRRWYFR